MSSKWSFYDPVSETLYQMQINANSENTTAAKNFQFEATAAPGGSILLFEGTDQVTTLTLSGTILSQSQYSKMTFFHQVRNQWQLVDDLGRVRWVYSSSLNPTRVRSAIYPWKMTYSWSLYVLSEELPTGSDVVFNANPTIG